MQTTRYIKSCSIVDVKNEFIDYAVAIHRSLLNGVSHVALPLMPKVALSLKFLSQRLDIELKGKDFARLRPLLRSAFSWQSE